ncbi:hypothetical protein OD997_12795 [Microbacterium sp. CGR1]
MKKVVVARTGLNHREQVPIPPASPRPTKIELEGLLLTVDLVDAQHQGAERQTFPDDGLLSGSGERHDSTIGDGSE